MNRPIFKDAALQELFLKQGYFILPLFSAEEVKAMRAFYDAVKPRESTRDFYSSIDCRDVEYRAQADTFLKGFFKRPVEELFVDYISLAATFIVKTGPDSTIYDHTDDCLVDESLYTSVNIWSPLVDTDEVNGAVRVLPGSHKIPNPYRGFGIPYRFWDFRHVYGPKMMVCPMRAGEALIYDPRLIHNSLPNVSGKERPAVISGIIPREATPIAYFHYPGLAPGEFEEFEVNVDFWLSFSKHQRPEGYPSKGIRKYIPRPISEEELLSYLQVQ
ncbi:MAG: hypothetical protein KatS3mg031_1999 [Chitinophagales bacterium]|nr:MAG: hypothetical protein KatS3mg031_1999 [Chitinophagales bacterium]